MSLIAFLKKNIRLIIVKAIPEIRYLEEKGNRYNLTNISYNSKISEKAVVYPLHQIIDSTINDYTYIARNSVINKTIIGKFCSIGPNLFCGWGIHPIDGISTSPMFYSTHCQNGTTLSQDNKIEEQKQITIGNDVFIGANVTILDGITIGDGAVIGAGAVVSKNIPPYAVALGCPIQIKKYRFDRTTREKLLSIKWWDSNEKELKLIEKLFFEVDKYIENHSEELAHETFHHNY